LVYSHIFGYIFLLTLASFSTSFCRGRHCGSKRKFLKKNYTACQKEKLKRHARACVRACVRLTDDGAGKKKERKNKERIEKEKNINGQSKDGQS